VPTSASRRQTCWKRISVASAASQLSDSGYTSIELEPGFSFFEIADLRFRVFHPAFDFFNSPLCDFFGWCADIPAQRPFLVSHFKFAGQNLLLQSFETSTDM
jgi:hypothetical protein